MRTEDILKCSRDRLSSSQFHFPANSILRGGLKVFIVKINIKERREMWIYLCFGVCIVLWAVLNKQFPGHLYHTAYVSLKPFGSFGYCCSYWCATFIIIEMNIFVVRHPNTHTYTHVRDGNLQISQKYIENYSKNPFNNPATSSLQIFESTSIQLCIFVFTHTHRRLIFIYLRHFVNNSTCTHY